jgi:hypothetical protein
VLELREQHGLRVTLRPYDAAGIITTPAAMADTRKLGYVYANTARTAIVRAEAARLRARGEERLAAWKRAHPGASTAIGVFTLLCRLVGGALTY